MTRANYEREWPTKRGLPPFSRLRIGLTTRAGTPVRFLVQLEYWHNGDWMTVARFDHDADGPAYRNVEQAGLHLDLYHPVEGQFTKLTRWPPQPANEAMGDAEEYLREEAEQLIRRFERWL